MEYALARHIALQGLQSRRELTHLLELLEMKCGAGEYDAYRKAVAAVDVELDAFLDAVFTAHLEVKRDLDDKIERYGEAI